MVTHLTYHLKALFYPSQILFGKILTYLQTVTQLEQLRDIYPGQKHLTMYKSNKVDSRKIKFAL